jgi:hypothetical protein
VGIEPILALADETAAAVAEMDHSLRRSEAALAT